MAADAVAEQDGAGQRHVDHEDHASAWDVDSSPSVYAVAMRQAARTVVAVQVLWLLTVHAVWLWIWQRLGYRPEYGRPESWSTSPLRDHRLLVGILASGGMALWFLGPLAAVWCAYQLRREGMTDRRVLIWAVAAILGAVLLWCDPARAVSWFMD